MLQGQKSAGHPVDVATGTVWGTYVDITLPGRVRLTWERRYSTALLDSATTPLGQGWTTRYFATLTREEQGYRLLSPEGDITFLADPEHAVDRSEILRDPGTFQELRRQGKRYILTRWNIDTSEIEQFVFAGGQPGRPWPLIAIEDGTGQGLDLIYDQRSRLTGIQQRREKRTLIIEYISQGLIKSVSLRLPNNQLEVLVRYEYDKRNYLRKAYNVFGDVETYEFDVDGRMTGEFPRGEGAFYFEYDELGRCRRTTGVDGYNERTFRYLEHVGWTEVTDSLGFVWRYQRNERGQIISALSPRGAEKKTKYDEFGRITSIADGLGQETKFSFDEMGNRTEVAAPDGATFTSEYNEHHRVIRITDPVGAEWEFDYDKQNRICNITHPTRATWRHTWDANGDLIAVENPTGKRWKYQFNQQGQLAQITNYAGAQQRFTYDARGHRTGFIDSLGGETKYYPDMAGRLTRVELPDGSSIHNTYDIAGNLLSVVDPNGNTTNYSYGPCCGRLLTEKTDRGAILYEWSTEPGRLLAIVDAKGQRHAYEYDDDGYLLREIFSTGRAITYERDLNGAVTSRVNGNEETTTYDRDKTGRVIAAKFYDNTKVTFDYDAAGRLLKAINDQATVEIERDVSGRRIKESCNGDSIESIYDIAGHRIGRTTSRGHETSYDYDPVGNVVRMALGEAAFLEFERDEGGRETHRRFPGNIVLDQAYDPVGRLNEQRVKTESGSSTNGALVHRKYEYDLAGKLRRVDDTRAGLTENQYDAAGRLVERKQASGASERFSYDSAGNITSVTTSELLTPDNTGGSASPSASSTVNREIGPGDQVLRNGDTTFEYDDDGRLCRKTQHRSSNNPKVWEYRWNGMGLLAEVQNPNGECWQYAYDALGRRICKKGPNSVIRYVWDGNSIVYEINGDEADPVTWVFSPTNFTPLARQENDSTHYVITDHLGTPRELIDRQGRVAWSGQLRSWGSLDRVESTDVDCPIRFPGQWFDPESGLHYNNLRYYDPELGSFISTDPIPQLSGPNGYRYALNPLNWIDPFGLDPEYYPLDGQNRPTGAFAEIGPGDTRPTGSSPPTVDPPGWEGGQHPHHQQRSHLIADTLGGSGSDARNLVTLTDGSNHPGMSTQEGRIRRHVQAGNTVLYEVRANYDGDNPRPTSVHMYAIDQDGNVIVDETVENGRRQNTSCC